MLDLIHIVRYTCTEGGTEKETMMGFSYKPLWKLLIDRDMPKKALYEVVGISRSTLAKMNRGENVSLDILGRLCEFFHCPIDAIIEYIIEEENNEQP